MRLSDLETMDESEQDKVLAQLLSELDLDSPAGARVVIEARLQEFEAKHKMTSAQMFETVDCDKRELDPELDEWATLYRCFKDIA